jgi:hypothetical protein
MASNWIDRYRAGQREQVWRELRQLGDAVRQPGVREEAQAVCDEMARRARQNVEVLIERLRSQGYAFHSNDDAQTPVEPYDPPTAGTPAHVEWLAEQFGPLPATLLAWARIVGDVWLVGTHPQWPDSSGADPLVVQVGASDNSIREFYEEEHEAWLQSSRQDPRAGPFVLPVSPDELHKANVSGGDPYGIIVPDAHADGVFRARADMPFVSYLNAVFTGGGFFDSHSTYARYGSDAERQVRDSLARDLLPL